MAAMNCIPPPEEMRMNGDWSSNWESFRAEFEDYSLATGLNEKSAAVQAATLRRVMGSECRHVYKHNVNLTAEQQENVTAILQALEAYFKPAKNIIYERYVFGCCKQEEGESFDKFVTRLREKAATCEYGALKDELIRDKIVLGIASESARRRLLREHDLTLNIAIETCRTAELTDRRLKVMEQDRQRTDSINIAMQRYNTSKPQQRRLISANAANLTACKYCGDTDDEAEQDHDGKLLELMDRCRQVKLRLGIKKLQFKVKEVRFHGHILSWEGLKADPDKLRAILDMPQPENVKSLQRFIGFVTYLAKFLPHLSEVCEPLRRLLDKDAVWHWLPKHDNAVQDIKHLVTDTPVLKYYDVTTPVTIQSDASKTGLGCCLLQAGQPIAFASRALTLTEQNYAQIEKECLSIVFACQRF
uniref:Reverse transcriptase/retrotransposon-derived protein RNase H-like domain-containing protein n=1 Tax=Leptobrachium leishanense TaxID=445787 RepID=A0A8C5MQE6_9ANUR